MDWRPGSDLWIDTDWARLEARCWGPPPTERPTIVLLHEGLGSVGLWRSFPEHLTSATGWGVLAYSRQGYGRSAPCALPRPIDYMEHEGERVLPQVLAGAGVQRCALLGHSDGGSIAALNGGRQRQGSEAGLNGIEGLVLIAPHFFVEDCSIEAIHAAKFAFETGDLRARLARHHEHVDCAFRGWNDAWLNPDFRDWNITTTLDHLYTPVLAIQGLSDPYGTRAQVDVIPERSRAPAEIVLIDDCGHAPHIEREDDVLSMIEEFLNQIETSDRR